MLLQRLRSAEPTVEAAIVYNLVDLAIISPMNTFVDIIRVFSTINRSGNRDDPRFSSNTVSLQLKSLNRSAYERNCRLLRLKRD